MEIQGKQIIEHALDDIKSFYEKAHIPEINVELGEVSTHKHATYVTKGGKSKLCFSKDFCRQSVSSLAEFCTVLITVSHELAHFLHKHNHHIDIDAFDSRVIEAWADFFGTRLFMTILTFGEKTKLSQETLKVEKLNTPDRLQAIGQALHSLGEYEFNIVDSRYFNRATRVSYCVCGVTSFLSKLPNGFGPQELIQVQNIIYQQGELMNWAKMEDGNFDNDESINDRILKIHSAIQKEKKAITVGLKKPFQSYLSTAF